MKSKMDYINRISHQYSRKILLHVHYKGKKGENIRNYVFIQHRKVETGWIIYSHEMILEWTDFYTANYDIKGIVFSDDGADCVYCIKPDGTITCFSSMDNEEIQIADTLWNFFSFVFLD